MQNRSSGIQPYAKNRFYWEYHGEPTVLIGGSDDDNIFQWTGDPKRLTDHLDLLIDSGGNYIRNTMSSRAAAFPYRDEGMEYPFKRRQDGLFDLDEWNPAHWDRLDLFLKETRDRNIIVQQELWDAFAILLDDAWANQPWNPDNNVNYSYENTTLKRSPEYPHRFFCVVPTLNNDPVLLHYQKRYVARIMESCLPYDNVIYQIDNESTLAYEVSRYWASFIHTVASPKRIYVCDSRRFHPLSPAGDFTNFRNLRNPEHQHALSYPELYNYTDISQNGGNVGQEHFDNIIWFRSQLLAQPRPINHTKIYEFTWPTGLDWRQRSEGSEQEGKERFWRTIFAGAASARHHRNHPGEGSGGLGLSPAGQRQLKSMRMLLEAVPIWRMEPANHLLSNRVENEAYLLTEPGVRYAVYFTGSGERSVSIYLAGAGANGAIRWLNIEESEWSPEDGQASNGMITLTTPGPGSWVGVITLG